MNLLYFLNKNIEIVDKKGRYIKGYVQEYFPSNDNEDGYSSIGVSKNSDIQGGIEISEIDIESIKLVK